MSSEKPSGGAFTGLEKWLSEKPARVIPLFVLPVLLIVGLAAPCGLRSPPSAVAIAAEAYQESSTSMGGTPATNSIAFRIVITVTNTGWRPIEFDTIHADFNSETSSPLTRPAPAQPEVGKPDASPKHLKADSIAPGEGRRFVFTGADTIRIDPAGWEGDVEFFFWLGHGRSTAVGKYAFQRPDSKDLPLYEAGRSAPNPGKPLAFRFVTNP